jgi:hypothetical protein
VREEEEGRSMKQILVDLFKTIKEQLFGVNEELPD